jgi:hypothetical protein
VIRVRPLKPARRNGRRHPPHIASEITPISSIIAPVIERMALIHGPMTVVAVVTLPLRASDRNIE